MAATIVSVIRQISLCRILNQFVAYADRFGRDHVDRFVSDNLVVNQSDLQKYKEHQRKAKLAWSAVSDRIRPALILAGDLLGIPLAFFQDLR